MSREPGRLKIDTAYAAATPCCTRPQPRKKSTHRPSCTGIKQMKRRPTQTERNRSTSSSTTTTSSSSSSSSGSSSSSNGFTVVLLLVVTDGYLSCVRCRWVQPRSRTQQKKVYMEDQRTFCRTRLLHYTIVRVRTFYVLYRYLHLHHDDISPQA